MSFDGTSSYATITDWEWGGVTSVEFFVKPESFSVEWAAAPFDFNDGISDTTGWTSKDYFGPCQRYATSLFKVNSFTEQTGSEVSGPHFDSLGWNHIVITVSGTVMKIYKNGILAATKTNGLEPRTLTRANHIIGARGTGTEGFFHGKIAFLKMWHGALLSQTDVTELYEPHNTPHHAWDFRGCDYTSPVQDSIALDLYVRSFNDAVCSPHGMVLDGTGDYMRIDPWEFGGALSFEIYVFHDELKNWGRMFEFRKTDGYDRMLLINDGNSNTGPRSTFFWQIGRDGFREDGVTRRDNYKYIRTNQRLLTKTWVHIVGTVSAGTMKLYINGQLSVSGSNKWEPNPVERSISALGSSGTTGRTMIGTMGFFKMWHGRELNQNEVATLYEPHDKPHHIFDFRGCTTGSAVIDTIDSGSVEATPHGATCSPEGMVFDG